MHRSYHRFSRGYTIPLRRYTTLAGKECRERVKSAIISTSSPPQNDLKTARESKRCIVFQLCEILLLLSSELKNCSRAIIGECLPSRGGGPRWAKHPRMKIYVCILTRVCIEVLCSSIWIYSNFRKLNRRVFLS